MNCEAERDLVFARASTIYTSLYTSPVKPSATTGPITEPAF
jgi:hypothetical protein